MSEPRGQWTARLNKHGVLNIDANVTGGPVRILWTGDRHIDSEYSDLDMQVRDFNLAREAGAPIIDVGDLFDAMQFAGDPRQDRNKIRLEKPGSAYANQLIEGHFGFLRGHLDLFVAWIDGNHDTKPAEKSDIHLPSLLAWVGNVADGRTIHCLPMSGWVIINMNNSTKRGRHVVRYHHGEGSATIDSFIRWSKKLPVQSEFDSYVQGHGHKGFVYGPERWHMTRNGQEVQKKQWFVQIGGYKVHPMTGSGFEQKRRLPPASPGAMWQVIEPFGDSFRVRWEEVLV